MNYEKLILNITLLMKDTNNPSIRDKVNTSLKDLYEEIELSQETKCILQGYLQNLIPYQCAAPTTSMLANN